MLTGKFHSHITVQVSSPDDASIALMAVGGKLTFIDLGNSSHRQKDHMVTHHFVVPSQDYPTVEDVIADLRAKGEAIMLCGIPVARIKLEHEIMDRRTPVASMAESVKTCQYVEIHMKVLGIFAQGDVPDGYGVSINHLSTRPEYFVTKRFQAINTTHVRTVIDLMFGLAPRPSIAEMKVETAIFDNNPELDNWWIESQ